MRSLWRRGPGEQARGVAEKGLHRKGGVVQEKPLSGERGPTAVREVWQKSRGGRQDGARERDLCSVGLRGT